MELSTVGRNAARFLIVAFFAGSCAGASASEVDYRRLRLPNGLTVIVQEDHKWPIVSLSVWYRTGTGDDPAGKRGFAHLFEHLMFYGSEHHDLPYLDTMAAIGGTRINAQTGLDWTAYYQTVPTASLDRALWLESDRMGYLLGALGEHKLEAQRGVVLNERTEAREKSDGRLWANVLRNIFPANHPYHVDPHGVPDDLRNATLHDVRSWLRTHHGAANATVVMAGDITPEVAREKAMAYFADIAPGPDLVRQRPWVVPLTASRRGVMHDRVAKRRIVRTWPVPGSASFNTGALQLAASILGRDKGSRLHRRLVVADGLASSVSVDFWPFALAGGFDITVDVAEGVDLTAVESALDAELATFATAGPTDDELSLAKTRVATGFLLATETNSGKGKALARGQLRVAEPPLADTTAEWGDHERMAGISGAQVREAVSSWLGKPAYTLTVLPAAEGFDSEAEDAADAGREALEGKPAPIILSTRDLVTTPGWSVDRSAAPAIGMDLPELPFPPVQRGRLANGIELMLAERTHDEFVRMRFHFGGGTASDQGHLAGTANFAMAMLRQGKAGAGASDLAEKIDRLGGKVESGCESDACFIDLSLPRGQWTTGLAATADVIRRAVLRPDDIESVRVQQRAVADEQHTNPSAISARLMARTLFGSGHPYAQATYGTGTRESIEALDADTLLAYRDDFLRPDNLHVIVVGSVSKEDGIAALAAAMGDWRAPNKPLSLPTVDSTALMQGEIAYLVDRPGSPHSVISLGVLAPPASDTLAIELARDAVISEPGSRLDANLRDAKGWTYGVRGQFDSHRGPRMLLVDASVQAEHTGDAVTEIRRELASIVDGRSPLSDAEIATVKQGLARSLTGDLEAGETTLHAIVKSMKLGHGDDFWQTLPERLRQTDASTVDQAFKDLVREDRRVWVIVGDRNLVEEPLRRQFPGLRVRDAEGRMID